MVPLNAVSASISGTTSSARTAYPAGSYGEVEVYNTGTVPVFLASGDSTVAATTSGTFLAGGQSRTFARDPKHTHLAAITASSTATVYFQSA